MSNDDIKKYAKYICDFFGNKELIVEMLKSALNGDPWRCLENNNHYLSHTYAKSPRI